MFVGLGYVHGTARQPQSLLEQPVQRAFVCIGTVVGAGGVLATCCPGGQFVTGVPARLAVVCQDSAAVNAV